MNQEEQRLAIAIYCEYLSEGSTVNHMMGENIPDFPESLDAMAKAEKFITLDERDTYQQWIYRLCDKMHRMCPVSYLALTASSKTRAEAFLRTKNLWK
jgi:hypothetical protein